MRRLVFAVLVAAFAVACSDQTTAPNDQSPALRAAQGDRSEWTYQWTYGAVPQSDPWPSGRWSCINGGQGEDVVYWGPETYFMAKAVETPSGNRNYTGYYYLGGDGIDHYLGVMSGDEWVSAPFAWAGKTVQTENANGVWQLHEAAAEDFTNVRTGQRVRVLFQWSFHAGPNGGDVGNFKSGVAISCHLLPH